MKKNNSAGQNIHPDMKTIKRNGLIIFSGNYKAGLIFLEFLLFLLRTQFDPNALLKLKVMQNMFRAALPEGVVRMELPL